MKHTHIHIFSPTDCLTHETIQRYAQGKLSVQELRHAELHLADCTACSDMLEGYELIENKADIDLRIKRIDTEIDARIKREVETRIKRAIVPDARIKREPELRIKPEGKLLSMRFRRTMAIAATLLLLISVGVLVKFYSNTELSEETALLLETPKTSASASAFDSIGEALTPEMTKNEAITKSEHPQSDKPTVTTREMKTVTVAPPYFETEKIDVSTSDLKDAYSSSATSTSAGISPENMSISTGISSDFSKEESDSELVASDDETVEAESSFFGATRSTKSESSKKTVKRDSKKIGKENFDKQNYTDAGAAYEAVIEGGEKDDEEALFFSARTLFEKKDFDTALIRFDEIISKNNNYALEAKWYKALTLIELDKKTDAKKILTDLSKTSNPFREKAVNKLNELK